MSNSDWPETAETLTVAVGIPDTRPEDAELGEIISIHRDGQVSSSHAWRSLLIARLHRRPDRGESALGPDILDELDSITRRQRTLIHVLEVK